MHTCPKHACILLDFGTCCKHRSAWCALLWQNACSLQNPTLSACWCVGLCQVMIPVISFSRDTTPFCKSMSIAESALFLVYSIFAFLCNLLGPSFFDLAHVFHFYKFPFSYTSHGDILVWGFLASYVVLLPYTRKLLEKYEQRAERRIAPATQE